MARYIVNAYKITKIILIDFNPHSDLNYPVEFIIQGDNDDLLIKLTWEDVRNNGFSSPEVGDYWIKNGREVIKKEKFEKMCIAT